MIGWIVSWLDGWGLPRRLAWLLLLGLILAYWPPQLVAQDNNRAALVVRHGDGNIQTQCVSFAEEQINGLDLLQRSGLPLATEVQGMGALVCNIGGTGCPADDCLCQCRGGGDCIYWSYWLQMGGGWQYSQGGSAQVPVSDGAVQGWSWGPGAANQAIAPPDISFGDVCQVAASPTPTAVPPTATATPTPEPSPTSAPQINFSVDNSTLTAGGCTTLRWQATNITAVYLDDIGVTGVETRQVCPVQTITYQLRVVHGSGEETRQVTVAVQPVATRQPAVTAQPSPTDSAVGVTTISATETAVSPTATAQPAPTTPVLAASTPPNEPSAAVATTTTVHPSPTATIDWIIVPPRATEPVPAAIIAAVPPTVVAAVSNPPTAVSPIATDNVNWFNYAYFAALVLLLSGLLLRAERQAS